jgi:uncharacterized protein (TIGR03382 family)
VSGLFWLSGVALAWPGSTDWLPLERQTVPLDDPAEDQGSTGAFLDVVGNASEPAAYWYADYDFVYLRLRVAGDPQVGAGFGDAVWGFLIEGDGDGVFEQLLVAESAAATLRAYPNADGVGGTQPGFNAYGAPLELGDLASGAVRRELGAGNTFFVDFQVPLEALDALGLPGDAGLSLVGVTGTSIFLPWADLSGCRGPAPACSSLSDTRATAFVIDGDLDGLAGPFELVIDTDPADADSDDDGLLDGMELPVDSDGDGDLDALDCDSDDDGILDSVESGLLAIDIGVATDLSEDCFVADADPTTVSNPVSPDSDGGGLEDGSEDWNRNGRIDPWETDPLVSADDQDSDGDGLADVLELLGADASVTDDDSDGDGLLDSDELYFDWDGDGIPSFLDDDSDGDGLPDAVETVDDLDSDGLGNFEDTDSDADEIPDGVEGLVDSDGDGTVDSLDLESDGDGVLDRFEGAEDFDGDGVPDYLDLDSDDDGLPDEVEGNRDPDNDGLLDSFEGDDDPDLDGVPNYEDGNSDGQGAGDATEGFGDGDCDGIEDWLDTDEEDSFCDPTQPIPGIDPNPQPEPGERQAVFGEGSWTGGGCSTSGGFGGFALPMLLGAALLRRRRVLSVGAALAGSTPAFAQEVDAQRFTPSVDGQTFVKLEDLDLRDAGTPTVGLWVNHAERPLVFRPDDGARVEVLGAVTTADLTTSYSFGPARVGASLPVHFIARGYGVSAPTHLGDLRLTSKARVLDSALGELGFRLGATLDLVLPTGDASAWVGSGRTGVRGAFAGELARDRWRFAANLGARSGTGAELGGLVVGPALVWAVGGSFAPTEDFVAALELDGDAWFGNGGEPGAVPLEWLVSGRYRPDGPWAVTLGAGTGIARGVGSPDFRLLGGVSYAPLMRDFDQADLD